MEEEKREESENTEATEGSGKIEKTEMSIDNNPDKIDVSKVKEKIQGNPWMVVSVVLLVAVIVLLIMNFRGGITGNVISESDVGEKLIGFANAQGVNLEILDIANDGNFYDALISINGQESNVKLTKDGENMVQLIPLIIPDLGQTQPPANIPKSDKPKVELFIMTHCPYGTQAEKGMIPVLELLGDKIDGTIRFVHYFMHEPEEEETLRQVCIREEQPDKFLNYLKCFLEDGDAKRCLTKTSVDENKLDSCISEKAEDYYAQDSKLSRGYGVSGSPVLVINGVKIETQGNYYVFNDEKISYSRSPSIYKQVICSLFNEAPEECGEELSSTTPSSMWGWGEGSETQAQC